MAQEREIATRLVSLGELLEIIAAIRTIAATQMQQALRSLEAIRRYSDTIHAALSDAAQMLPSEGRALVAVEVSKSGLIVFCAEHGLCGGFNEQLARVAEQIPGENRGQFVIIMVGSRGGQICRERGLKPDLVLPMATHGGGVTAVARRLATEVYGMLSNGRIVGLEAIYAQHADGEAISIERHRVLPLEAPAIAAQSAQLAPLINLGPRRLFDDIVAEYFFAALENAAMQSFFSENSARFRTMEAAHQNIGKKSEELSRLARRLRQEIITTEILDLISGVEAISSS